MSTNIQATQVQASDTQTVTLTRQQYSYLIQQAALRIEFSALLTNQIVAAQAAVLKSLETENPLDCFNDIQNSLLGPGLLNDVLVAHENNIYSKSFIKANVKRHPLHPECIKKVETELAKLNSEQAA